LDSIDSQLRDLVKLENPQKTLTETEYLERIALKLNGKSASEYGVWVYYPWKNTIVHLLDEEEFVRVRTIRNAYKITFEEQALLRTKKVGVIGLSVGQSVALTIALERIAGEIRIADFDTLELSNMNRIRTGVDNLGIKKTTMVAREIAEIDPFIKVVCFDGGITKQNVPTFFEDNGVLDLLIEECDSVDVKIMSREEAKKRSIPVVMETSDKFLIDVERFDLDKNRPILHGLLSGINISSDITPEEKRAITNRVLDYTMLSNRGLTSIKEIGKTITTWPQLASDVFAGGAILAQLIRNILLGNNVPSGRMRLDVIDYFLLNGRDYYSSNS